MKHSQGTQTREGRKDAILTKSLTSLGNVSEEKPKPERGVLSGNIGGE